MDTRILAPFFSALLLASGHAVAAPGMVNITSPMDGTMVGKGDMVKVSYEAAPGPDGDHLHLYLDGKRIDVIRPMKGTAEVGMLEPGKHRICMEVNTRGHVPTGAEACVNVTSK